MADVKRLCIEVPATITGLGPGAGTLGLALDIADVVRVEIDPESEAIEGEETLCAVYRSWPAEKIPGARFALEQHTPRGKGLGEHAALTVAGLSAADFATETKDRRREILRVAATIDAVPPGADIAHLAAALLGGMTTAFGDGQEIRAAHVVNHMALEIVLFLPEEDQEHAPPPQRVSARRAGADRARLAYLTTALIWGRWDRIAPAMQSSFERSYRATSARVIAAARDAGAFGASLAGSGPTVVALASTEAAEGVASAMEARAHELAWPGQTLRTTMREAGVVIKEEKEPEPSSSPPSPLEGEGGRGDEGKPPTV